MSRRVTTLCLSALLAAAASAGAAVPQARVTVLVGGNLLDGTGAPVRSGVDIVITDDRITAISASGSIAVAPGATRIDMRGRYILPGLIDSHVHYQAWMGGLFLNQGVTSVFDLGNELKIFDVRDAIRAGRLAGPRLYVAGLGIQGVLPSETPDTRSTGRRSISRSVEEAVATANATLDRGADVIKVREWIPAAWMREVVKAAHARNKPVVGHLTIPTHEAIEAGVDSVTHAYGIDLSTLTDPDKLATARRAAPLTALRSEFYPLELLDPALYGPLIELAVKSHTVFNPAFGSQFRGVLPAGEDFERYDEAFLDSRIDELGPATASIRSHLLPHFTRTNLDYIGQPPRPVDAAQRGKLVAGMKNVAEFMRQFVKAGGRMVAGTDTSGGTGGIAGIRLQRELELWVAEGIEPMEAIRAATQYPAELLRLPDLGTVEVGKKADLLVLRANPLEDIRFLGAIDRVFLDGKPVSRELDPAAFLPLWRTR